MNRKVLIIIGIGVVIILAIVGFLLFGNKDKGEETVLDERANTLILAREYQSQREYQRALDLLDGLLVKNAQDEEVRDLRNSILADQAAWQEAEQERRRSEQDLLTESLNQLENRLQTPAPRQTEDPAIQEARDRERRERELAELEAQIQAAERRRQEEEARLAAQSREERERAERVARLVDEGVGLLGQGNFAQARSSFDQAIALDAQSARAYAYKAESYFQENPENASALQQAVENANRAVQYDQNLWVPHNTLGKIYAQQRNWDQAITEFREAARLNPQDADVLFEMGKAQYRAGAFDAARQTFESSIYLNSGNSRALYNLGITYLRLANPPTRAHLNSALSAQQRAVAVDPAYAEAQFALGDVLSRLNRDGEALTAYRQAATLSPDNITYHIALGTCSYRLNRYGDAEASFRRALQIQGDHPTANYNLALTLDQEGKSAEALPFALQAVQAVPNDATYGYTLGKVYQNLGNTGEAIAAYERAASLRRDYLLPRINLGDLYDQQGEYAKALEHLLTAYRIDPNSVEVNTNLGNTYFHSRIYDRAITHYEQALSRNPNDALMRYHLALACIEAGQDAKAQGLLTELIALAPDYWDAYYRLGNLLYKGGETQQASDIFRNLLNRNPNYPARAEIEPLILP